MMRQELLAWFAQEGLLLQSAVTAAEDPENDEIKISVRAPLMALSRAYNDFRECPDPLLFGYSEDSLEMMTLEDFHWLVMHWFERAVAAGMARCFVCNQWLEPEGEPAKPWDAIFASYDWHCWLVVHFDCKKYLQRDLKGRHPFEISAREPELFDLRPHEK